jgi:hypothetical protein
MSPRRFVSSCRCISCYCSMIDLRGLGLAPQRSHYALLKRCDAVRAKRRHARHQRGVVMERCPRCKSCRTRTRSPLMSFMLHPPGSPIFARCGSRPGRPRQTASAGCPRHPGYILQTKNVASPCACHRTGESAEAYSLPGDMTIICDPCSICRFSYALCTYRR